MMVMALAGIVSLLATSSAYATSSPSRALLVTRSSPSSALPDCIAASYHGQYGGEHVYVLPEDCSSTASLSSLDSGSLAPLASADDERIVWIGPSNPDSASRRGMADTWDVIARHANSLLATHGQSINDEAQDTFSTDSFGVSLNALPSLIHSSDSGLYLSVPNSILPVIDTIIPPHMSPVVFPPSALTRARAGGNDWAVPEAKGAHLANITKHLRFDSTIDTIASSISADEILEDVRFLTGERKDSPIQSRHSFHPDGQLAVVWLRQQLRDLGISCAAYAYQEGFNPGLLCSLFPTTDSEEHVIMSAHVDSRGTFGSLRAPGADDDASGTAHLLAVGRAIAKHNITFAHPVTLAFFTGEEQGLVMSNHFAHMLQRENISVRLNVQADMLGYHVPGEPMQLALPATIGLAEASYLVGNVSELYAPELVLGRTPACCSDHQSFHQLGFPATQVFERNGPIADPMYHNSGDLSDREGYDVEQIKSIAKVTLATLFEVAGWQQASESK